MAYLKRLLFNLGALVSRFINVLRGGSADMPFSAASYIENLPSERWINRLFKLVRNEDDHCLNSWVYEVDRARATLELSFHDRR